MRKQSWLVSTASIALISFAGLSAPAYAQFGQTETADQDLKLAADSPFRDPDIIYLEADVLTNDEETQILTAQGEVEGRYQDKTLRADRVVYHLDTGQVFAEGNVVLLQPDGSSQYADKIELSNELEAGTATDFVARLPDGGVTAARFVARGKDGEIELYNAYYTACEICEDKENPSWRLKARQVTQDRDSRTVQYRDAVFELFGVPIFYTPFLAHPDSTSERASGILTPVIGFSNTTGLNARVPYYWAVDDHTEVTLTPRVYTKVNPLLSYSAARQFHTGRIEVEGSVTYGSIFDNDGDAFDDASLFVFPNTTNPIDPDDAPVGRDFRGHIFAKGLFRPSNFLRYGFGFQYTSDDNFLRRYDLNDQRQTQGLYEGESGRNTSQAFIIGQDESTRVTLSAVGFQDRRDRITEAGDGFLNFSETDDGALPVVAPRLQVEHYLTDPILSGRLKATGNLTVLNRDTGSDYTRGTVALDYSKTWIAPGGIEVKPFGNIRADYYEIDPDNDIIPGADTNTFDRTLGQVGADIRYPFVKLGENVTWILEPRAQITQSFGDARLDEFVESGASDFILSEDAGNADLTASLLWQTNKSSGFDFWQEGTRIDVGGTLTADWGERNSASLFVGQSFSSNTEGDVIPDLSGEDGSFLAGSGLEGSQSDIVGEASLNLGRVFSAETKLRYDEESNNFTRIDSTARLRSKWVEAGARYFRLDSETSDLVDTIDAPPEEITGFVRLNLTKNWSTSYRATRDLEAGETQRQTFGIRYRDECTLIEVLYNDSRFNNDAIRDNSSIGVRISLLTLGDFGGN